MLGQNYDMLQVLVSDIMAMLLLFGTLIISRNVITGSKSDALFMKILAYMLLVNIISDLLTRAYDGVSGLPARIIVYVTNYIIFLCSILSMALALSFWLYHVYGFLHKGCKIFLACMITITFLFLILNMFMPVIFYVDGSNCYKNGPAYFVFVLINFSIIPVGVFVYIRETVRVGTMEFFSPALFAFPSVVGIILQVVFPRVSAEIPMLSITGVFFFLSLLHEAVYKDKLTGLFNRYYLDHRILREGRIRKQGGMQTALMMDLNHFKSINDTYGHEEGDIALKITADILARSVVGKGKAIRYAGDEFVVILFESDPKKIEVYKGQLEEKFSSYNQASGKNYQLSLAIGYEIFDSASATLDQLMNVIDRKMYEDKKTFYKTHRNLNRRK